MISANWSCDLLLGKIISGHTNNNLTNQKTFYVIWEYSNGGNNIDSFCLMRAHTILVVQKETLFLEKFSYYEET